MTAEEQKIVEALILRRQRLEEALLVMRKPESGGDVSRVLLPEEFTEVRRAANDAAENKLVEMLAQAKTAVEAALS